MVSSETPGVFVTAAACRGAEYRKAYTQRKSRGGSNSKNDNDSSNIRNSNSGSAAERNTAGVVS